MTLVPQSVRGRLVVALLAMLAAVLGTWLCAYSAMLDRQQTGGWDSSLRVIAHQILLSLPGDVERLGPSQPSYRLPEGADAGALDDRLSAHKPRFQVWLRGGREGFRSPGSPAAPLRADFANGFADTDVGGERWRVYSIGDASGRVHVQVAWSHAQLDAERLRGLRLSIGAAAALFVLLVVPLWFVVCWSLRPVTAIESSIRKRQGLDLAPLPTAGLPREVAPLVDAFNQLLRRLDESLQVERRFIADAAHELRTPMAALLAQTQLALDAPDGAQRDAALARLREGVQRSARLAEQMLDLARLDAGAARQRRTALYELVEVVVRDFDAAARQRGQRIVLDLSPGDVMADVDMLGIALRNLVDNAVRYAGDNGRIAVRCAADGPQVVLSVADDGAGVPAAEQARIFDRFYRVPGAPGRGSGIGLSLVARIAELHRAQLATGPGIEGRGFGITLRFDAAPDVPPPEVRRSAASDTADTRTRLLAQPIQR
jgi:two-component system sensor histidine kinase QseC